MVLSDNTKLMVNIDVGALIFIGILWAFKTDFSITTTAGATWAINESKSKKSGYRRGELKFISF